MPEILLLSGIPTSGKSSWCRTHQEIHNYIIISRDDIREKYMCNPYIHSKHNENEVTRIFDYQYNKYTKMHANIILDNTYCKSGYLDAEIKRIPEGYTLRIIFF